MCLEFEFIRKEQYNCIENVLATLMKTLDREYELMFAKAWGFTMIPSEISEDDLIGYRIGGGEYKVWECLETYYNVNSQLCDSENHLEQIQILDEELSKGRQVVLEIDGFYTPWKDVANKYHLGHYCLVVNKDKKENSYGCIDPYENSLINPLPKENLEKGHARCITLKMNDPIEPQLDWQDILVNAAKTILIKEDAISGVDGMRALAKRIKRHFDIAREIEGYEEMIWVAPIILRLSDIGSRRLNFSECLIKLHEHTGIEELLEFAQRVEKTGWDWRRVRRTIVTSADDRDNDYKSTIANMIEMIADKEETIAKDILDFANRMRT